MHDGYSARTTLRLSEELHDGLEALVESGEYPSKSEAIRDGVREILEESRDVREREEEPAEPSNRADLWGDLGA